MAEMTAAEKAEAEKAAAEKEAIEKKFQADVDAANAGRTGIGTRQAFGFTRGKGSMPFTYERFDDTKPDTLPQSVADFITNTGVNDDGELCKLLIIGYNDKLYTEASDPIAEHVNATWADDVKTRFRLVVRNYMTGANASLEDAVALIKPGFEKALASA